MRKYFILALPLAFGLALGACQGAPAQPKVTSTVPSIPTTVSTIAVTPSPIPATSTATAAPTELPTATATQPPRDYGPENFPANVDPLTGMTVSDPSFLERRPLAVKIQLFPRGQRPPWGISSADVVFDYYQNNGLTRLHAIFLGTDAEKVGPIRSGRLLDARLINSYKSIFAFGSADARILKQLFSLDFSDRLVMEGSHNCPPLCREDPNGFNYLVTNTKELSTYISGKNIPNGRQDLDGMTFTPQQPAGAQPGTQVFTRYSISAYSRWDYDLATGRYLRFQDTQEDTGQGEAFAPLLDRLNNQQVTAANVVVLFIPHQYQVRSGNSEIVEILLNGTGPAVAFRDGQAYPVVWNRPTPDSVVYLTFQDGTAYAFKPGNTWFEVVGQSSEQTKPDTGVWRFVSRIP